jgi:hypothetical protein
MFRPRETMIALRARHEAMEVSREIAYPPLKLPDPPLQSMPVSPDEIWYSRPPEQQAPPRRIEYRYEPAPLPTSTLGRCLMSDVVLGIAAIVIGVGLILLCRYG